MFLISEFRSYFIFLNFQAYFSLRNSTLAARNYSWPLKILAKIISMSDNKSSRQKPLTSNFTCLAAKHVMFAPSSNMFFPHVYTLWCNRRYDVRWPNFELIWEWEWQGDKYYYIFLWTRTRSPLFSSNPTSQLSSHWVTWFKWGKFSKGAKSIFQRRFH